MKIPAILPENWETFLNEREIIVLNECVIGAKPMTRLAVEKNVSPGRIKTIRDKAIKKLRAQSKIDYLKYK